MVFLNPWVSIVKDWQVFCIGLNFLLNSSLAWCAPYYLTCLKLWSFELWCTSNFVKFATSLIFKLFRCNKHLKPRWDFHFERKGVTKIEYFLIWTAYCTYVLEYLMNTLLNFILMKIYQELEKKYIFLQKQNHRVYLWVMW